MNHSINYILRSKKKKILLLFILHLISIVPIYSESGNTDCFWYGRHVPVVYNENGELMMENLKFVHPDNDGALFEFQFDYKPDFQTEDEPLTIYLNEVKNEYKFIFS